MIIQLRFENSATKAAEHAEVVAVGFSRRRFRDGRLDRLSRIDRCFVGTTTVDMLAVRASAVYLADVAAPGPSRPRARANRLIVPSWVRSASGASIGRSVAPTKKSRRCERFSRAWPARCSASHRRRRALRRWFADAHTS